jgi:hypothetical protein
VSASAPSLGHPLRWGAAALAGVFTLIVGLPVLALLGLARPAGGGAVASPVDAAALDGWMAEKVPASPLVGLGAVFVDEGVRNRIDPRALVAIAHHESVLGTAGSGAGIHNAFGWGPGIPFPSWEANIAAAARGLARGYVSRGRDTLAEIQPLWAPLVGGNDPLGLNSHWTAAVGRYYEELGGDPSGPISLPRELVLADVQAALCPHGGWGGTQGPIEALAGITGLPVTSLKRERRKTKSGGVSDHYVGCTQCYAADLGTAPPAGDVHASRIATAIAGPGYGDWGSTGGVLNAERCGIRFNLLWRTYVGGNHFNHIHIGARRVGYVP